MPIDWSTRPSSSIATHSEAKSPLAAAPLLGEDEAEQPELAHRRDDVDGEVVVAVPLRGVRGDLGLGEVAHRRPRNISCSGDNSQLTGALAR